MYIELQNERKNHVRIGRFNALVSPDEYDFIILPEGVLDLEVDYDDQISTMDIPLQ